MSTLSLNPPRLLLVAEDDDFDHPLPADATDEYKVQDVLDMLEVAARARGSASSIAPTGFDVDPLDSSAQVSLVGRRRRLLRYVIGGVGAASVILAASLVKRTIHDQAAAGPPPPRNEPVVAAPVSAPAPTIPAAPRESATAGLVRFTTPSGWAWLDGEQLSATAAFVPCGTHRVQIGGEEQHDVEVPCGGEVVVSR